MYVCVCNAVTDKQIHQACEEGACSMRLLRQKLGVAGCCGRCAPAAYEVLKQCKAETEARKIAARDDADATPAPAALASAG